MTTRINKRLKIVTLQDLKSVVDLLSPFHVKSIKIDGIELEFDTTAQMISRRDSPETIDDQQDKIQKVSRGLEDLLKDADTDEFWSSAP